jgi:TatD-related deoxyribonuclease
MEPASLPFPLPIVDHHLHLRPGPAGLESVRRFVAAGGTDLFLATQNYGPGPPTTRDGYREQFDLTVGLARQVERECGARAYAVVAPYPVDLIRQAEELGLLRAEALQLEAMSLAASYVEDERAVALGEVGSAHFPIEAKVAEALERILRATIGMARDLGCPLVLHTEELLPEGYRRLGSMAGQEAISPEHLIKHYARPYRPPAERFGVTPSFLARKEIVREALSDPGPWFLETDYLDDPSRPGAVMSLESVPKRVRELWRAAVGEGEREGLLRSLSIPFVEGPQKLYGLDLHRREPFRFPAGGPGGKG